MKHFKILIILLFSAVISLYSCKDKESAETSNQNTPEPLKLLDSSSNTPNSGSPWHYTCSNGCAGGAAAAGNCSSCGNALVHNQAFHSNTNNTINNTPANNTPTNPSATPKPEPSQNAAGVWHYTCSKGCAGGAGSAVNCSTCGNALTHNAAYH